MRPLHTLWLLLALAAPALGQFGPVERRVLKKLTAVEKARKLIIHYQPTVWMLRIMPGFRKDQERAFIDLEGRLGMTYAGKAHIFVYHDAAEMARLTGVQGAGAFSAGRIVHTPFMTYPHHELTHILALQWNDQRNRPVAHDKKATDYGKPEYKFIVEGLADAMTRLGTDRLPIRHWVAFHHRLGAVPPLAKLMKEFPKTGTLASGSWIAGSFVEYLLETRGIRKVKRWYFHPGAAEKIFGQDLAGLENDWLRWLEATPFDSAEMARALGGEVVTFEKRVRGRRGQYRFVTTADDIFILSVNGGVISAGALWSQPRTATARLTGNDTIRVLVVNRGGPGGLLMEIARPEGKKPCALTDTTWKVCHDGRQSRAVVLGKPVSGIWGMIADEATKKALRAIRGSWIWHP